MRHFKKIILILSVTILGSAGFIFAEGIPVKATPFDAKFKFDDAVSMTSQGVKGAAPEPLKLIFFKAKQLRYLKDEGRDHWQTPRETEINGYGDCEDKAIWLFKRLRETGYENVRVVVGKLKKSFHQYHAWVEYTDEKGIAHILDASTQTRIWRRHEISSSYFVPFFSYDEKARYMHPA